jgi:hypothetical protein
MSIFAVNADRARRTFPNGFRRTAVILTALGGAFIASSVSPSPASAGGYLGGIHMTHACEAQYGGGIEAVLTPPFNADDWGCYDRDSNYRGGIDVHKACRDQYGRDNVHAWASDENNAFTWGCYYND